MQDLINDQVGVLGALKNLREGNNPDYKGTLPPLDMIANNYKDTEIQMMARAGAIDPSVVGPAIKRKETLNNQKKQAMAGNTPPSVLNRIMQRNAMAETGIANIAGNNIANPNLMRSGGIVAFNPGGQVQDPYANIGDILTKLKQARDATVKPPTFSGPEAGDFNIGRGLLAMAQGMDPSKGFVGALSGGIGSGIEGLLKSGEEAAARRQKEELAKYTADSGLFDTTIKNLNELRKIQATGDQSVRGIKQQGDENIELENVKGNIKEKLINLEQGYKAKNIASQLNNNIDVQTLKNQSNELIAQMNVDKDIKVADIKAKAPPELLKMADGIRIARGDEKLKPEHIREASDELGKNSSVEAAMVNQATRVIEGTMDIIADEYNIQGLAVDMRTAAETPELLDPDQKKRLDKAIEQYNNNNPKNKIGQGDYRTLYEKEFIQRNQRRFKDVGRLYGIDPDYMRNLMQKHMNMPSGTGSGSGPTLQQYQNQGYKLSG